MLAVGHSCALRSRVLLYILGIEFKKMPTVIIFKSV